ncbi:MAG: alcohol dehydrogenase [Flammeovirgaceae bacterium]|nr:alcohol dehydrogenase [Flammeovirgaceae bacterium]MBE61464.1 alcohol dehydrogenase [Flammeovirgaceae bacterium]MBR10283.1 alcohol dehydrogenase [Rickettsiales bacterium]HCX22922.1 alcohol dehydrogenase [Cytophagales bacterium]|tara:strand:+ start:1359 stop:2381 length:1023 start_codon:yes stop_codon:yes gene_type:complete
MKAYTLVKNGKAEEAFKLEEKPTPTPGPGEVLIESEGFGLNFADVMARLGIYKECPPLPTVIGYENVGKVKELGEGVTGLEVGQRVLAFTRFGGYADHVVTPAMAATPIPDNLSIGEATALATQYMTAYYAVEECLSLYDGDHALVHAAAGGVGTALIQMLKHKGVVVFGTAGSDEKLEYLRSLGVDYPVNYRKVDYLEEITKLGFKGKIDATFNPIGGDYVKKDFALLNSGGGVVIFGASKLTDARGNIFKMLKMVFGFGFWSPIKLVTSSKSLIGLNMLKIADHKPRTFQNAIKNVIELVDQGVLKPTVGKEFDHTQLAEAHAFLESRKSIGKIAVKW